jgi:Cys-tRNA(Pro) deacylase
MKDSELPAIRQLRELAIPHQLFVHAGAVRSLEQAAAERGQRPEQVVRSLLFRLNQSDYALVLVAGPQQIPWKTLRRELGQRRLTLASEEEVLAQTGYQLGAVTPFGLPHPIPIYIEASVLQPKQLSLGSGRRGTAILIDSADLAAALPSAQFVTLFA